MKITISKQLRALPYFTIDDLARICGIRAASAHVLASRHVKSGEFIRVKNDFYILDESWGHLAREDHFRIANYLQVPSYISFMSALSYYELTTQVQRDFVESASLKRSVTFEARGAVYAYYKLQKNCYGGFVKVKDFFIATPEKALIDSLYLYSFGKYRIDLSSIDMTRFNTPALKAAMREVPERTRKVVKKLCRI